MHRRCAGENRRIAIGSWFVPAVWGTGVNTESKRSLLSHAFENLGAIRVEFDTDTRNLRSQAALSALGAVQEGLLRSDRIMPDGARRDETIRTDWVKRVLPTVSIANIMRDVPPLLAHFAGERAVRSGPIGTTGYCLGGKLSLAAAGTFPGQFVAAASYHGGHLATDDPDSPHRLAPKMKARVYVGAAIQDPSFDDAQKQRLEEALTAATVDHQIETSNARHG